MTPNAFASWLDAYGRAWTSRDPQAAADLFAEHGTYQVTPFLAPIRGRQAIFGYWTHVTQTEQDIQFGYEILALTPEQGAETLICLASSPQVAKQSGGYYGKSRLEASSAAAQDDATAETLWAESEKIAGIVWP